jgi:hypothetical protein
MNDYRPTYPVGFSPRYLRGEYFVAMDTPRQLVEAPRIIPPHVHCQIVPPGAALRDATNGQAHRWNNQHGEQLAASLESAAVQSRRSKAAAKALQAPKPPKAPKEDRHVQLRDQVLGWLQAHGPATRPEIADGLGLDLEATRNPINRLLHLGLIKARHYSLAGSPGHKAQYLPIGGTWPRMPAGATSILKPRTSRRRPTE